MRVKTFAYTAPFFSIKVDQFPKDFETWISSNPGVEIKEIRPDAFSGSIWHSPQLIVSVYYLEK